MEMKSKVRLCTRSLALFLIYGVAFFIPLVLTVDNTPVFCSILALCILIGTVAGMNAADWVIVDDKNLTVKCMLRRHRIVLRDIRKARLYHPQGQRVIFGSCGFLGYWGLFEDNVIGRYRAYYGHSADTFLVTLNDGRQYVIGCLEAANMVRHINARCHPRRLKA